MNWLDIVLAVTLGGSTFMGMVKGFARTIISIAAAIIGFTLALWFYGPAGALFSEYVSSKIVANFLGFVAVFACMVLLGAITGRLLSMIFKREGISWLDRTLGSCFGLLRGLLVGITVVMILMAFSTAPPPKSIVDSRLAPYVVDAARILVMVAPRELTQGFQASYDKLRGIRTKPAVGTSADTPSITQH
ncbi:MAG: CvpA family protein [Candidatus Solibacter usitatus]|nr:CvpA family protein [Candidatus Solibacter usitatus]